MPDKLVECECDACESSFEMAFETEMTSEESPLFCPFCGERIEHISEEYITDDDLEGDNDDEMYT